LTSWAYPTLDPHAITMRADMLGCAALYTNVVRLQLLDPKTWEHKLVADRAESWA